MYIVKATRTSCKNVADAYRKGENRKIEYSMYFTKETKNGADFFWDIIEKVPQSALKRLYDILPKDENAKRLTGGGITLEYTVDV